VTPCQEEGASIGSQVACRRNGCAHRPTPGRPAGIRVDHPPTRPGLAADRGNSFVIDRQVPGERQPAGEWREKTAYRPLARLLRCPADEADAVFGDAIPSTSHRVMAAVFDGDPQPLYDIILDPDADGFVRSRMCEALAMVTLQGQLDRAVTGCFLRDAYNELQPQRVCYVWFGWQSAIAMLGLGELKVLVKRAFDRGFIDPHILGFADFERDLKRGIERPGEPWRPGDDEYALFGDTVEALSGWHCFTEQHSEDQEEWRQLEELDRILSEPHHNPFKGIGRNDPCPCGSGKKFKKCCLQ